MRNKYNILSKIEGLPIWLGLGIKVASITLIWYLISTSLYFLLILLENINRIPFFEKSFILFPIIFILGLSTHGFFSLGSIVYAPLSVVVEFFSLNHQLFLISASWGDRISFLGIIFTTLTWFLIGALIGFIVSKIKRKNENA